jgi:hypothetical protein
MTSRAAAFRPQVTVTAALSTAAARARATMAELVHGGGMKIPDQILVIAERQASVVSRRQLYAAGLSRGAVRHHIKVGRWQRIGDQSICLHNGPLSRSGHHWAAVFQGGPRACLDGTTALIASGLERFTDTAIRVSVPRGARVRRTDAYDIRQTRRWAAADIVRLGVPRTQPAVAAVRAALWTRTDREATYVVTVTVQQGLAAPEDIGHELLRIRRDRRRQLLHAVVLRLPLLGLRLQPEEFFAQIARGLGLSPRTTSYGA